jgi:hypothetical protein
MGILYVECKPEIENCHHELILRQYIFFRYHLTI